MHALLLSVVQSVVSFSVPDTAAWHYRLELSATAQMMVPGADDFYQGDEEWFTVSSTTSTAAGGAFRFTAHMPERRSVTWHFGFSLGERELRWSEKMVPLLDRNDEVEVARMTFDAPMLELVGGAAYHPWRRHFFGLELVLPIQIGDGSLKYEVAENTLHPASSSSSSLVTVHSEDAPASFRQAATPRVMLTYDYRLFDRIDCGLGFSPWHGDYFAHNPEADIDSVGHISLRRSGGGPWFEMHVGWTFGRARDAE